MKLASVIHEYKRVFPVENGICKTDGSCTEMAKFFIYPSGLSVCVCSNSRKNSLNVFNLMCSIQVNYRMICIENWVHKIGGLCIERHKRIKRHC